MIENSTWIARQPRRAMLLITLFMVVLSAGRLIKDAPVENMEQTTNWWPVVNEVLDGNGFRSCLPQYFPFCGPGNDVSGAREPLPVLVHAAMAALSGRSLWAAALLQILMNIAVAWLLFSLGSRWRSTTTGVFAAALWALYLPAYQILPQIAGDQLAGLFVILSMHALLSAIRDGRWWHWAAAGVCIAGALLSRSSLIALLPGSLVAVLFLAKDMRMEQRIRSAALLGLACAATAAPWVIRNRVVFDQWVVGSTLSGYNLFRHNALLPQADRYHYVGPIQAQALTDSLFAAHPELKGTENEAEMNAFYKDAGKSLILEHPVRFVGLSIYRLFVLWTNWRVTDAVGRPSGPEDHLMTVQSVLLLLLAAWGWSRGGTFEWALLISLVLFCGLHMAVVSRLRYVMPFMPFVLLYAAIGLERISGRWLK